MLCNICKRDKQRQKENIRHNCIIVGTTIKIYVSDFLLFSTTACFIFVVAGFVQFSVSISLAHVNADAAATHSLFLINANFVCVFSTILVTAGKKKQKENICVSRNTEMMLMMLETSRIRIKRRGWKKL